MNKFLRFLKLVGIPFIIALGIYTFIRFVWLKDENTEYKFTNINTEEYLNLYYDSKESIVFIFKDTTDKKDEYEQIIRDKFTDKSVPVYYYNITNLTDVEVTDFINATEITEKDKDNLPMLVYTLKGQTYDILKGYHEEYYIQDFIDRNNIG